MGNVLQGETAEEPEFHDPALARVESLEGPERIVERHEIRIGYHRGHLVGMGQRDAEAGALPAKAAALARHVNQDPAHDLASDREEMGAILPAGPLPGRQAQVRFVDERRGLEQVARPLPAHLPYRHPVQLALDAEGGRWLVSQGGGRQPVWSRDGTELFYRSFSGAVMSVRFSTQPTFTPAVPVQVLGGAGFHGSGTGGSAQTYAVARDGRFLMLKQRTPGTPALILVTGWTNLLRSANAR